MNASTLNASASNLKSTTLAATLESLGETIGDFKAYDSQLSIPEIPGTRIVKCLYQARKGGEKIAENSYVRIPTSHLTEELVADRIEEFLPYVVAYLQEIEDSNIKSYHRSGGLHVYSESLSLDKILETLEESNESGRLNAAKIEAWFAAEIEESLATAFAEKLGLDENSSEAQLQKLEVVLSAYKNKFISLASGKTFIKEADCLAMITVIRKAEAENSLLGKRFIKRLEGMQKKEEELLLAL